MRDRFGFRCGYSKHGRFLQSAPPPCPGHSRARGADQEGLRLAKKLLLRQWPSLEQPRPRLAPAEASRQKGIWTSEDKLASGPHQDFRRFGAFGALKRPARAMLEKSRQQHDFLRGKTMDFANALPQNSDSRAPVYEKVTAEENSLEFMTFTLGEEEYGIDIMTVREIKGWTETTTFQTRHLMCEGYKL
jgi:hypothetical protein